MVNSPAITGVMLFALAIACCVMIDPAMGVGVPLVNHKSNTMAETYLQHSHGGHNMNLEALRAQKGANDYLKADDSESDEDSLNEKVGKLTKRNLDELIRLWPLPKEFSHGDRTFSITPDTFEFVPANGIARKSDILVNAIDRYQKLIFDRPCGGPSLRRSNLMASINITLDCDNELLNDGRDESYELKVDFPHSSLHANTVWGALHGLETFSQLVRYNSSRHGYFVSQAPWNIKDAPRFRYRGLLIDTSRHWLPPSVIKRMITSMTFTKLNVLHWHLIDAQSFPAESRKYPKLWNGAWSESERYTQEDIKDIIEYARVRGVRVLPEIDGPGHAWSWGVGYPELLPANNTQGLGCLTRCPDHDFCRVPLDPSKPLTYEMYQGFLEEMIGSKDEPGVFSDPWVHLGGDEVDLDCWNHSSTIRSFMKHHNMTVLDDLETHFLKFSVDVALKSGHVPILWDDVVDSIGVDLDKRAIVQVWLHRDNVFHLVEHGYQVILSDTNRWYLDILTTTWESMYLEDPHWNITDDAQKDLVLGGTAAIWGEHADTSNVEVSTWPRAAAVAERLWSPQHVNSTELALPRLQDFRCLLLRRGIPAGVWHGGGRRFPAQPSSCYD